MFRYGRHTNQHTNKLVLLFLMASFAFEVKHSLNVRSTAPKRVHENSVIEEGIFAQLCT